MKNENGFTLLELIVVIAIIGILIGIACPNVSQIIRNNKNTELSYHKVLVEKSLKQYYAIKGKYPSGIGDLALDKLTTENYGVNIDHARYTYSYNSDNPNTKYTLTITNK